MTDEPKRTLTILNNGGSGRGPSHHMAVLRCPKRAVRRAEEKAANPQVYPLKGAAGIGTVFHFFAEHYYDPNKTLDGTVVKVTDLSEESVLQDGMELWRGYRSVYPDVGMYGEVVGTEIHLDDEELRLTGDIDMVVRMDATACRTFEHLANLEHETLTPGIHILDWKSKTRMPGGSEAEVQRKWAARLQFSLYPMLWDRANPDEPCQGVLVVMPVKGLKGKPYSRERVKFYHIPTPSETRREAMLAFLTNAQALEEQAIAFPSGCEGQYDGLCQYHVLEGGDCEGM